MAPSSINVVSHLTRLAQVEPDRPAIHVPKSRVHHTGPSEYTTLTFAQLNAEVDALAHGLTTAGITRGTRTALMVPPSIEFFTLTFALFKIAAVPVLIDPGMGVKNLKTCLGEAEPEAFVGIAKAHLARRILGWAKSSIRTTVNVGSWRFFCHRSSRELRDNGLSLGRYPMPDVTTDDTAAILFTSGSTGVAKGAVYTHGIFAAQVEMLKATYGIEPGEVDLCTFPLFALFGPALGMTCVIPDMDFTRPANIDVRKAVAQIEQFQVTNLFGSPAVIAAFATWEISRGWRKPSPLPEADADGVHRDRPPRLPTLRRVISAGAPANPVNLERCARLLNPGVQIFTPYGATESLPVANIGSREILTETRHLTDQGRGVCVGKPVAGITVYVVPITDEPMPEWDESQCLPTGEIGEFVIRGPVVTKEYFHRPEATKLAKMRDPRTGEILHRMGDVGYLDEHGRLWYCGRKSHRVVTPHGTLFTEMVEGVFNTLPDIYRTALVGVKRNGIVYPVLCFEVFRQNRNILDATFFSRVIVSILGKAESLPHLRELEPLPHSGFPMDIRHNSKIFREKLAVWADQKLGPNWNPGAKT